MRRISLYVLCVLLSVAFITTPCSFAIESPLEDAILKGNWEKVISLIKKYDSMANDPVPRLIMGHATLATNKNNESMSLFLSIKEKKELKQWSEWTNSFLLRKPQNSITLYLSADSKARTGKIEEAEEMLTKALELREDFALAYNLRGIIHAVSGEALEAKDDLNNAIKLNPGFVDAYYNRGLLYSHMGEIQSAIDDYTRAIDIKPSGLAYNGRGVVYWQLGMHDLALNDLEIAKKLMPDLPAIDSNIALVRRQKARSDFKVQLASGEKVSGRLQTEVNIFITDFGINQQWKGLKTGDDFTHASNKVFNDIPKSGQVLIVMPPDNKFKTMTKEQMTQNIFDTIKPKIYKGVVAGNTKLEFQLIEHMNTGGYVDPKRQKMVNAFGESAYKAIGMAINDLKSKGISTNNYAIVGSNGAKVFTENVPAWKPYIERVSMYDGRAFKTPTIDTIKAIGENNVTLFNTAGDYAAPNNPLVHSIGNHNVTKNLKKLHPGINVTWLHPIDRLKTPFGSGHVAGMSPESKFLAKEFTGSSYTTPKEVTASKILSELHNTKNPIPSYWTYKDRSLNEAKNIVGLGGTGLGKALVVGTGKEADFIINALRRNGVIAKQIPFKTGVDYQKAARNNGANAIYGVNPGKSIDLAPDDLKRKLFPTKYHTIPFGGPPEDGGGGATVSGGLPGSYRIPSTLLPQTPGFVRGGVAMAADVVKSEEGGMDAMLGTAEQQPSSISLDALIVPFTIFPDVTL